MAGGGSPKMTFQGVRITYPRRKTRHFFEDFPERPKGGICFVSFLES